LCLSFTHAAPLRLSNTIGSHMVLQRAPQRATIWGWANPMDHIVVSLSGKNYSANAQADGAWQVALDPMAAGGPYTIIVSGPAGESVTLTDILFGDLWLCGGQSNMQFTVHSAFNSTEEIAKAASYPNIRLFTVGQGNVSDAPLNNLASIEQNWNLASAQSVGAGDWSFFSAVCWFFGRDLYDQYKVPIGLLSDNWGGTFIQAWSSPDALGKCAALESVPSIRERADPNKNSVLWNAMIVPWLKQPIRGAIWYQGEANVGQPQQYACLEPAMIADWRAKFGMGFDFPFLFVQLAPWRGDIGGSVPVADLRQAQLAGLNLKGVGYASAVDLGDATSPFDPIHPRNKQTVAKRLVQAARNIAYGETTIAWEGPTFNTASVISQAPNFAIQVSFSIPAGGSLVQVSATCPAGIDATTCSGWQVLLSDGNWRAATNAVVQGSSAVVNLSNVAGTLTVRAVRYAYSLWPLCSLFDHNGLPAIPFQHTF